jgi:hypothetical protein
MKKGSLFQLKNQTVAKVLFLERMNRRVSSTALHPVLKRHVLKGKHLIFFIALSRAFLNETHILFIN